MRTETAIKNRFSIREFNGQKLDSAVVKDCLEMAMLAPNSSNLQLWELHRVVDKTKHRELAKYCLNQSVAISSSEMIVLVTTPHKWKTRVNSRIAELEEAGQYCDLKRTIQYYKTVVPLNYRNDRLGMLGLIRKSYAAIVGLVRPAAREVGRGNVLTTLHKNNSLAAMNFMIAMSANNYDTCPIEGFDSLRIKRMLDLPKSAEITMVIACGVRKEGHFVHRSRVSSTEVIIEH
ncbi:MAG: nitroreductase family protein [Vibrio splendidus]